MSESTVTRAEYVVLACAEIFSGAGEIMASPMSTSSTIGARLARLTTEPDLLITDGEALILEDTPAVGTKGPVEGWMPFRKVFDVVASGRRHVVMGANQLDRHGNQNLSAFGPLQQPTRQMFGVRGAPGNTINHATSYFVPKHSKRVFVDKVDVVCGVGYDPDRSREPGLQVPEHPPRRHQPRCLRLRRTRKHLPRVEPSPRRHRRRGSREHLVRGCRTRRGRYHP